MWKLLAIFVAIKLDAWVDILEQIIGIVNI